MKILCYGDSNTWGHNPKDKTRIKNRWPKLLQNYLKENVEIIEEGLCGRCAAFMDPIEPYRHGISMLIPILKTHQPIDIVIIMLGTNDLKACFSPNEVAISNGIKEMIHIIKNAYNYNANVKVPQILIVSPILIKDDFKNNERTKQQFAKQAVEISSKLAGYYLDLSVQYDCHFLDASLYAQASSIDCIHMDEENHEKLAKVIYEKLMKW